MEKQQELQKKNTLMAIMHKLRPTQEPTAIGAYCALTGLTLEYLKRAAIEIPDYVKIESGHIHVRALDLATIKKVKRNVGGAISKAVIAAMSEPKKDVPESDIEKYGEKAHWFTKLDVAKISGLTEVQARQSMMKLGKMGVLEVFNPVGEKANFRYCIKQD
ncbi:MAG: hypothetical protein ACRCVX_14305 [Shewanella sp.]